MSEKEYGTEITLIWADGFTRDFPVKYGLRGIRHGQLRPMDAKWTTVEPYWIPDSNDRGNFIWLLSHIFARDADVDAIITKLFGESAYEN